MEPSSLTPVLSRRAALALAAVAALPGFALLTYGWGLYFGAAWALAGLLLARAARGVRGRWRVVGLVAMRVGNAFSLIGSLYQCVLSSSTANAMTEMKWALGGNAFGALAVVAWFVVTRGLFELARPSAPRLFPRDDASAALRCARGLAWVGAIGCVVADESLWPLMLAAVVAGVALAARTDSYEARAVAWLHDVAAGRVAGWGLRSIAGESNGRAWLMSWSTDSVYRGGASTEVATVWASAQEGRWYLTAPHERAASTRSLTGHVIALGLCCLGAAYSHGYLAASPRAAVRPFVIDGTTP